MNYILKDSILCPTVYKIVQKWDELQHHELDQSNNSIFSDNYSSTTSENLNNSHNFDHNLINEYSNECKLKFGKPPMFPKIQKNGVCYFLKKYLLIIFITPLVLLIAN